MKVAFAHNVFDRFKTLKETIGQEREFFPDSNIFVACNSRNNDDFFKTIKNCYVKYYTETPEHKIGCVNGLLLACNMVLEHDFDVLIFSHDDVRINPKYFDVVMKNISDVQNDFDLVYRNPVSYGSEYAMMEALYMNKRAVEILFSTIKLLKDESEIGYYEKTFSICPELWFFNKVKNSNLRVNIIKYDNKYLNDYNIKMLSQIGFEHLNAGSRGWKD
jgi:hypothetical protein